MNRNEYFHLISKISQKMRASHTKWKEQIEEKKRLLNSSLIFYIAIDVAAATITPPMDE